MTDDFQFDDDAAAKIAEQAYAGQLAEMMRYAIATKRCLACDGCLHCYSSRRYGDFQRRSFKCRNCGWRPSPSSVIVSRSSISPRKVTISADAACNARD